MWNAGAEKGGSQQTWEVRMGEGQPVHCFPAALTERGTILPRRRGNSTRFFSVLSVPIPELGLMFVEWMKRCNGLEKETR